MSEEKEKKKKVVKEKAIKKPAKKTTTKTANSNVKKASTKKSVDANFDAQKQTIDTSLNTTLNNEMSVILDTKKMIENEKQRLKEEYKDLEKPDDREIELTTFNTSSSKAKKTISIEDIANAINAANEKEEQERKRKEEHAKRVAIKKKKAKIRAKKKEERKTLREEKAKVKKENKNKNNDVEKENVLKLYFNKTKSLFVSLVDKFKNNKNDEKENNNTIKNKKENVDYSKWINNNTFLFIAFVLIFLFMFGSMLIPKQGDISSRVKSNLIDTENLTGIDKIKADIENYIVVQFPFYETVLDGYFGTLEFSNRKLYQNANDNELILIDSKDGIYIDGDENQLIRKYEVEEKNQDLELGHRIKMFNKMAELLKKKNVNSYIYAVSGIWTSEAILNFELDYKEPLKYVKLFEEKINDYIKFDYLKIIDYTTFKQYFFATDHHWRIHGAYQGYKDICKLLGIPSDELVPPNFFKVEGVEFLGSNAKICSHDNIIDYLYDIEFDEEFTVKADGKDVDIDDLSARNDYLKGDFEKDDVYYNHYGKYFHSDLGEIIYTFPKNKKTKEIDNRRLLIISDSYSNCIDKIIASHFYKTYVVDLRYYESSNNEKFVLEDYIDDNKITDCLIMLSANSVYFESADLDLGLDETKTNEEK